MASIEKTKTSVADGVLGSKARREDVDTGIESKDRRDIATALSQILADSYLLVIKSHVYHWNVTGPVFRSLHLLTEEHYNDLFAAVDVIAERVRALGFLAPVSRNNILEVATIQLPSVAPTAKEMVEDLISDHESLTKQIRTCAKDAEEKDDFVTHDMLTARLTFHEKAIWMLRAIDG